MADKIAKRGVSIYIDGKEVANSVKAISGEMKKLTNEQSKMTMGADNYVAHAKKIEYLKSLLVEHKDYQKQIAKEYSNMEKAADKYSKNTEGGFSRLANGFNKYFAIFTAGLAAVTGLTLGLKKFMDMRNELEQSSANLKAITGLDDKSVAWMRQYAKELSTTTTEAGVRITATSKEIMDGFTVIGSKRPELLKNKEAMADVTKQALTLAATGVPVETAFEVVTASMNQFNLTGKDATRIINSIAAGSLEGSAEADSLAGSLKNVGTVANDSNMTMEDTVAMLEVLASKQLVGEEAGTKLRGALLKLKEAGVGYASGQFNVRDAIIEVNKQMDKKANALQRDALLQKIFGAENVTAGTILLQNVDAYDKLRVSVTGTDVAMRQARIQTSTITAQMAQAQNRFNELGMELVKNLNPAMLKATNFGTNFMKLLMQLPTFLKENKVSIVAFVAGLTAYLTVVNLSNMATKARLALAVIEKVADYLKIVALRTRIALTGQATIAELRLLAAQNELNASMMKNIWGLVAAAIAIATVYLISYLNKANELTEAQKIANGVMEDYRNNFAENSKAVMEEKAQLTGLVTAIINTNDNQATRNRLIDELNAKYPGFISFIDKEKVTNELLAQALADVNEQYDLKLRSVALNSKSQAYEQASVKAMQRQIEIQNELNKLRSQPQNDNEAKIKALEDEDRQLSANIKSYENASSTFRANAAKNDEEVKRMNTSGYYDGLMNEAKKMMKLKSELRDNSEKGSSEWNFYNKQVAEANAAFKYAQLKYIETKKLEKANKPTSDTPSTSGGTSSPDKTAVQKKKIDQAMQELENDNLKKIAAIKQQYIDGDIKTEYDYNQQLLDQQDNYDSLRKKKLQELLKVITDPGLKLDLNKQIAEIDKKALDRQIEQNNKIKKILLDADPIKSENQSYSNRLRELGLFGVDKEKMTADQLETLRILEEQHNEAMRKLSTKQAVVELKNLDKEQQDAEKMLADERLTTQMSEQIYKDKMISLELSFMRRKLAIQGLSADEIDKITKQINQKLIDNSETTYQLISSFKEKYGLDELSRFKLQKETELKILQEYVNKGLVSEKDATKVRRILAAEEFEVNTKNFKDTAGAISDISGVFSNALQGFQSAEEKSIETKYQKQIDAAQKAGKDTTKIEAQKNKELASIRAKNADAEFALQVAQIIATTAVAAINSFAAMSKIGGPILGGIAAGAAVAYGASQIAVAESAREAAKEGYYDGGYHTPEGYTGGTDPREVRGVFPDGQPYHGDEFIATHKTTRNREIRPVLDLIDSAQKLGTASSLTRADISKALRLSPGYYDGGYRNSNTPLSPKYSDDPTAQYLSDVANSLNRLNDHLDKGINAKAPIYLHGSDGLVQKIKEYETLLNNSKP